jgi:FAR-17a/AIG1-like protein
MSKTLETLEKAKSTLLVIALPVETLITFMYWILYFIDPRLVVNKKFYELDVKMSIFTDMCMHLFPILFLLMEFIYSEIKQAWQHVAMLCTFTALYVAIMHLHFRERSRWPYGIIAKFQGVSRYLLFVGCFLVLCMFYIIETELHKRLVRRWRKIEGTAEEIFVKTIPCTVRTPAAAKAS